MRMFDCHSHWSTKRGYIFRTEEELASQERIWQTKAVFETEQEMTETFRRNKVRVILDGCRGLGPNEPVVSELQAAGIEVINSDVVLPVVTVQS